MKCSAIIALATGAYATQDTTPPVITLSLSSLSDFATATRDYHAADYVHTNTYGMDPAAPNSNAVKHAYDQDCTVHKCPKKNLNNFASVTCEVDSTPAECPMPTCDAHDHHDGKLECSMHSEAINVNNNIIDDDKKEIIGFTRNLRAEWLLKYDAVDHSGNTAETVSFTMIFHDVTAPTLVTEWGSRKSGNAKQFFVTAPGLENTMPAAEHVERSEAESCSMQLNKKASATAPCTWTLAKGEAATDDYDGDVSSTITRELTYAEDSTDHTATFAIDTQKLGKWVTKANAHDHAGIFGKNEKNNEISQMVTINVVDTTKPTITSDDWDLNKGFNDHQATLECGVDTWVDPGANCWDTREQWNAELGKYVVKRAAAAPTVVYHHNKAGTQTNTLTINAAASETTAYTVTYSCQDDASPANVADNTVRHLTVQDTTDPVVELEGNQLIENSAGDDQSHAAHNKDFEDKTINVSALRTKVTCTDECDNNPTIVATLHYGADCKGALVGNGDLANFPEYTAGDYSVKYVCSDGNEGDVRKAHTSQVCRTIQNVDHTLPIITVLGAQSMVLEATHTGNYVDDGAVCSDQVDGVISQNVEVSGDVVNLSKAGAYEIVYNCQDSAGNSAPTVRRSVTVKQTTCPTCTLNDADKGTVEGQPLLHEASFPYTDAGVVCQDVIDGVLTEPSSYDITNPVAVDTTGVYVVTYRAKNSAGLWSNAETCRGGGNNYLRTVQVKDTLKPIIQIKYGQAGKEVEVARSDVLDTGIPDSQTGVRAANPAADGLTLMGEQQGSAPNAWVLAAAASAVTGLALLGYSSSRVAATSVPV
jgi:hypothetical protein